MATPSDVAGDVAAALAAASRGIKTGTRQALRDAADVARRNAPTVRLRNMRGARTGARVTVGDDELEVTPTGPVGILEPGARPHTINSRRPMPIGRGRLRRGPLRHPGTSDTKAWTKGQDETFRQVERSLPESIGDEVESAFRGG